MEMCAHNLLSPIKPRITNFHILFCKFLANFFTIDAIIRVIRCEELNFQCKILLNSEIFLIGAIL